MTLAQIAVLVVLAAGIGRLKGGRQLAMLGVSVAVLFWLQPAEPLLSLGFWLPFCTVALTVLSWALTADPQSRTWRTNWPAAAVILAILAIVELNHFLGLQLTPAISAPSPWHALIGVGIVGALAALLLLLRSRPPFFYVLLGALIVVLFVIMKVPDLAGAVAERLYRIGSGGQAQVVGAPLAWLGFSYVAFRLLHTVRDRQAGRLPSVTLSEYVNYVIFFPAFTAGPIDRIERFVTDLRAPLQLGNDDWLDAGTRLILGLFKKFVVADLLAVISISDLLVENVRNAGWMWLFLYAYAFRIYFDFSGYTDMAIGMGRLLGVRLPENFSAPYQKQNLALFWNSWHMSLTQWFRSYVFNPLTRRLRSINPALPTWLAVLVTQVVTMVLIGLWHGITSNFALWGLWHGLGLFVHNRWVAFTRDRGPTFLQTPALSRLGSGLGILLTFNFVALGWLLFGLSTPSLAWKALVALLGRG